MPTCWICGAFADSSEHMVKASDIRGVYGRITNTKPVFRHSREYRNEVIPGSKSDKLKFAPSLCTYCNSTRTQPHDRAWERFSGYLRERTPHITAGARIPVKEIFHTDCQVSMKRVHLYFVKLFGCYAVEYKVPLPINHFALCILNENPNPNLRLSFVHISQASPKYGILVNHINALNVGGKTVSASWFYIVGVVGVLLSYTEPGHPRLNKHNGWHPDDISPSIRMA